MTSYLSLKALLLILSNIKASFKTRGFGLFYLPFMKAKVMKPWRVHLKKGNLIYVVQTVLGTCETDAEDKAFFILQSDLPQIKATDYEIKAYQI
jgi:hypothetical protein